MSRRDYDHWNEDADYIWWQEEGRHEHEPEYCDQCGGAHSTFDCPPYEEDE